MIRKIVALLAAGLHVGVVTAAGYPGDAARFEGRLKGLLVRAARMRAACVACAEGDVCVLCSCTPLRTARRRSATFR